MSTEEQLEAIKEKFRQAMPHFRAAMADAKEKAGPHGEVGLGVIAVTDNIDDMGTITARFRGDEFFEDIATLCGIGPTTGDEELEVAAKKIVDRFGAANIVDEPT